MTATPVGNEPSAWRNARSSKVISFHTRLPAASRVHVRRAAARRKDRAFRKRWVAIASAKTCRFAPLLPGAGRRTDFGIFRDRAGACKPSFHIIDAGEPSVTLVTDQTH